MIKYETADNSKPIAMAESLALSPNGLLGTPRRVTYRSEVQSWLGGLPKA